MAETTDTYTFAPPERSVFSPENISAKTTPVVPVPLASTGKPMTLEQVDTKRSQG